MGCCNQSPNGGTKRLGKLLLTVVVGFAVIFLLALLGS